MKTFNVDYTPLSRQEIPDFIFQVGQVLFDLSQGLDNGFLIYEITDEDGDEYEDLVNTCRAFGVNATVKTYENYMVGSGENVGRIIAQYKFHYPLPKPFVTDVLET